MPKFMRFVSLFAVATLVLTSVGATYAGSGTVYLPLVFNNGSQMPPTSIQLIQKDLAAGKLDQKTAAIYEVYSLFTNSPLPAQYRGAADPMADIAPLGDLEAVYASLSASQKAAINPYLVRPDTPSSAENALSPASAGSLSPVSTAGVSAPEGRPVSPLWDYVDTATGVRIHYRLDIAGDKDLAVGVGAAIDDKIYTKLSQLMNRVWKDDTGCTDGDVVDDGGNGALDIYLEHDMTNLGEEISCGTPPTPGWVRLNASQPLGDETDAGLIQVASHEMLHAIQDSYTFFNGYLTYLGMEEATAVWVEDYIYPNAQAEQGYASEYMNTTRTPLTEITDKMRIYGAYLWPFYLYRIKGYNPNIVRLMFENAKSYKADAVFMLMNGDTSPVTLFPDFAVKNWNRDIFNNYQTVDKLTAKVPYQYQDQIGGVTDKKYFVLKPDKGDFEYLTATYYDFIFNDATARTVSFYNGISDKLSNKTGAIWSDLNSTSYVTSALPYDSFKQMNIVALIKMNNTWTREDWTSTPQKFYCRDQASERIQELVLIVTNSNWDIDLPASGGYTAEDKDSTLMVSAAGCYQWKGTFEAHDTSIPGVTDTTTGTITFERDPNSEYGPDLTYHVLTGSAHRKVSGTSTTDQMTYSADGTVTLSAGDGNSFLDTYNLVTGGPHPLAYYGSAASNQVVKGTLSCYCGEDGAWETYPNDYAIGTYFLAPDPTTNHVNSMSSGNVIQGSYTIPNGDITYSWHLEAQADP